MSSSLTAIWSVLGSIWSTFFTGWKIPLLNFTPATLVFGVLSFFVAIKFMMGILTVSHSAALGLGDEYKANREQHKEFLRRH